MNKPTTLYEHLKSNFKKLKIVCDWDEVIQACEPYAYWIAANKEKVESCDWSDAQCEFPKYFWHYWFINPPLIEYSPYGSKNKVYENLLNRLDYKERMEKQVGYKNSPDFYYHAPFLTIAEDLLELIKEKRIAKLIFLSAYDKRKFPNGDPRKIEIFKQTFYNFHKVTIWDTKKAVDSSAWEQSFLNDCEIRLELIPFDNETQGQSKAEWIKRNASNFDLVIDDNPNICKKIIENNNQPLFGSSSTYVANAHMTVIAPYYPTIKHDERVLLVKNEVSELKKEDFK